MFELVEWLDFIYNHIFYLKFVTDRVIQGSGFSGPIPSGIALLTKITDL